MKASEQAEVVRVKASAALFIAVFVASLLFVASQPAGGPEGCSSNALESLGMAEVAFHAYDSEGYILASWTALYPCGYAYIEAPPSMFARWDGWEGYVDFWKWGDGCRNLSRRVYICGPASFTIYYKTPITALAKVYVGKAGHSGPPTDFIAQGYAQSVHGRRVAGVIVEATFHLTDGSVRECRATSTSFQSYCGWFVLDVYDPPAAWLSDIKCVELRVASAPEGYQNEAGVQCWIS